MISLIFHLFSGTFALDRVGSLPGSGFSARGAS